MKHGYDEVVGIDADGHLIQWDAIKKIRYNSGETLEAFGIENLTPRELQRITPMNTNTTEMITISRREYEMLIRAAQIVRSAISMDNYTWTHCRGQAIDWESEVIRAGK